jgi:hypothetical protein
VTIKRYYYCDLCGEQIEPTSTRPAVGIYWDCNVMRQVPSANTEHHLCIACVSQIQKINTEPEVKK